MPIKAPTKGAKYSLILSPAMRRFWIARNRNWLIIGSEYFKNQPNRQEAAYSCMRVSLHQCMPAWQQTGLSSR